MRILGKRQLGELELSEFIVAALVADLAATPLQEIGTPLLNGLIPMLTLFCLEIIIAGVSMRRIRLRSLIFGKPEIIIKKGRIDGEKMRKNRFTVDELMQEMRNQGVSDVSQVEYAVLETNGKLSILLKPSEQPATPSVLGVKAEDAGYTHIVINDGRVLGNNLQILGYNRAGLLNKLRGMGITSPREVYLMTISDSGKIYCQRKDEKL